MLRTEDFFAFARERYQILLNRRAGLPKPWTQDHVLQSYRFCNVFREDDRVTEWFRTTVRDPLRDDPAVIFATIAFRFFNTIKTGERLVESNLFLEWSPERAREVLSGLKPLITGAYMVKTPIGVSPKLEGLIQILDPIWADRENLRRDLEERDTNLQLAHRRLMRYDWVGGFMAYEFVTDLSHTYILEDAGDIYSWANPGPGATRGLQRFAPGEKLDEERKLFLMRWLCSEAHRTDGKWWPLEWPEWTMREVEHLLCETDKYWRTKEDGGRPKQLFVGS